MIIEILIASAFAVIIWATVLRDWFQQRYGDRFAVWLMNRRTRRRARQRPR